ncbi:MAG: hypothetical protein ACOCUO_03640 [archaeon]
MTAKNSERYAVGLADGRTLNLVPEQNRERLNEQQLIDYVEYRRDWVEWLRITGKNPKKREGYSDYTAYETAYKTARFDRWAWGKEGRYTVPPAPERATEYVGDVVAFRDVSNSTKGKIEEALVRYYDWASDATHVAAWDHEQRFTSGGGRRSA